MRLNEKYINWAELLGETGTPTYHYTVWTQLIKNATERVALYCPSIFQQAKFDDNDLRGLDNYLHTHYGQRNLMDWFASLDIGVENDVAPSAKQTAIRANLANSIFEIYGSKWEVLLEVLGTEKQRLATYKYSPVENVFEHIEEYIDVSHDGTSTLTKSGSEKTQNSGTLRVESPTNGDTSTLEISGSIYDTPTGTETKTKVYPNGVDTKTTEHQVAGFDSQNYQKSTKDIEDLIDGEAEQTSYSNRQDERSFDDYEEKTTNKFDDLTTDNRGYTTTYGLEGVARQDETEVDLNDDTDRTLDRHGNIGTMTSGEILEGEWVARSHLIYKAMCDDLMNYIATPVY